MQFLEKIKKSIFSLIILILLIISFFIFKFALQKEKIYSPKMSENQIFTDFEVVELIEEKQINFNKVLLGKKIYLIFINQKLNLKICKNLIIGHFWGVNFFFLKSKFKNKK